MFVLFHAKLFSNGAFKDLFLKAKSEKTVNSLVILHLEWIRVRRLDLGDLFETLIYLSPVLYLDWLVLFFLGHEKTKD